MLEILAKKPAKWLSDRDPSSFAFIVDINLNFGTLRKVITWCEKNLEKAWGWQSSSEKSDYVTLGNAQYSFYFDDARDATTFSLRWQS